MSDPNTTQAASSLPVIAGAAVLGGLVVAAAVAFVTLRGMPDEVATVADPVAVDAAPAVIAASPEPATDTPEPTDRPATLAADPAFPVLPRFDLVRIDAGGSAVIAGQAAALAEVTLALDGEAVETVTADAAGQFVAMLALAPSDRPRLLSLLAVPPDGVAIGSEETVLIAPFAGDAMAAATVQTTLATPPDPPPATRADPPGLGEATSSAPRLDPDGAEGGLDVAGVTALAGIAPDEAPGAQTDPAAPSVAAPGAASDPGASPRDAVAQSGMATPGPAVVLADRDGVRVLQGAVAAPEAMTELQLDAITYDVAGEVTLAGRGPAAASVRVTLNNRPINLGEIGPGGQWSLDLPDVDPGTYTLRLDQVAADGTVTRGIETPFLREDPARIRDNPMLVDPGASVITVQRGFTLWGIAEANFGDGIRYVQIFEENRDAIRDPDLIFPGQIFALPDLPRTPANP